MKITALKPDKEVKWTCTKGPQEWIDTKISFSIAEDRDKHTQIIFEHDGWKDASDFYGMCNYHWGLYLKSLKNTM